MNSMPDQPLTRKYSKRNAIRPWVKIGGDFPHSLRFGDVMRRMLFVLEHCPLNKMEPNRIRDCR